MSGTIHAGKRTVVVSYIVIGEVIQVVRREATREVAGVHDDNVPSPLNARDSADEAVGVFFSELGNLSGTRRVIVLPPSENTGQHASLSVRTMIRHGGRFEPHGRMGLIYRGLGIIDIMHALAALDCGAQNFCTRDRQFSSLAGDPEFDAINFVVF